MPHNTTRLEEDSPIAVRELYPNPRILSGARRVYEELGLPWREPDKPDGSSGSSRPYVLVNMVGSVDGKVETGGSAAGIGSPVDRTVMRTLRSKADAVMVGAGTLRAEKISLSVDDRDSSRQPTGVIVSSSGNKLPFDHLIAKVDQDLVLISGSEPVGTPDPRIAPILAPTLPSGDLDLHGALMTLKRNRDIETVLVEGGPTLNHTLFSQGLVDELFITVAPKLLGGGPGTIVEGPQTANLPADLRLLSVFLAGGELFLRYAH